jgi:hypothetical protein
VEHFRERTKALVLHERENPIIHGVTDENSGNPGLPQIPKDSAVSLPALLKDAPALPTEETKIMDSGKQSKNDAAPFLEKVPSSSGELPKGVAPASINMNQGAKPSSTGLKFEKPQIP